MSQLPKDLLDILACPRCRGPLAVEPESLRCDACRLRYRVDNGIPVMLIHEAEHVDGGGDADPDAEAPAAG
jgi:uncharacterized protein YbaR (Trm112 family)